MLAEGGGEEEGVRLAEAGGAGVLVLWWEAAQPGPGEARRWPAGTQSP